MSRLLRLVLAVAAGSVLLAGCERPPVDVVQTGYRGTGMQQVYNPRDVAKQVPLNQVPEAQPPVPADGPKANQVYQNVKVLGDLSVAEFTRTMAAMTQWVAPKEGCAYCHNLANLADDSKYTKVVARKMVQMTQHLNMNWKNHVGATGVTCYTCHRGNPVPENIWFGLKPNPRAVQNVLLGDDAGQNKASFVVGSSSLPYDPFGPYLSDNKKIADIRVNGTQALPYGNRDSTKQAEHTYSLMIHMSQGLGVNCTYCHNTQNFAKWEGAPQTRVTAYHGIRMVGDANANYLVPLTSVFPENRLGPTGDVAKVNCATCHQGAYKPLYGASMLKDYPEYGRLAPPAPPLPPTTSSAEGATLFFGVGSAVIAGDALSGMQTLVDALKANPRVQVAISGYHSAAGDLASNQKLARDRAVAVRDALKTAGIAEGRFALQRPVSAEANLSGEDPQARRVEVLVRK
jgi:photosynthetic reaction center cytochrome c subunit